MLIYKNVLKKLKDAGYNTIRIRNEKLLPSSTVTRLNKNEAVSTKTLEKLCELLNCRIEDIVEYIPEQVSNETKQRPDNT